MQFTRTSGNFWNSQNIKKVLKAPAHTNALISESSPYLLQHAHNPVAWHPWNDKTLQKAEEQKKLMIVSIGYAACHWCHVMEKESFEDLAVADIMNRHYISLKVDREERPDVDHVYINAIQLMTGSAGWPLNVITLPDGRPVWGGTYFKKDAWISVLEQVQELYEKNPQKLEAYASRLTAGMQQASIITTNSEVADLTSFDLGEVLTRWKKRFDPQYGGSHGAPKFMMPGNCSFLLRYSIQTGDNTLLDHVILTLDKMAYGGIYDQIGGGFSRYSVDEKWHVPHFEKMLYDNAQLVSLYSNAWRAVNNKLYKEIVTETLDFIASEMTSEEGAFYSSLDADSFNEAGELEEGAYYTYTKNTLEAWLKEDFELFQEYYNVNLSGLWEEGRYILIRDKNDREFCEANALEPTAFQKKKKKWKETLLSYRNKRSRPCLDDKSLTSWNGLMVKGYVDAFKAFQKKEYLIAALKNARFISERQRKKDGGLYHNYKNKQASINGYLEDYALVIEAFIALYEITLDNQWLQTANELAAYTLEKFYDASKGMFYFTSKDDTTLISRPIEFQDNVIPASNSVMAKNLFVLSRHFENNVFSEIASKMLSNVLQEIGQYPGSFSNWLDLLINYTFNYYEVVVTGAAAMDRIAELSQAYLPNILISGSTEDKDVVLLRGRHVENQTLIYICKNNTCKLPVTTTKEAIDLINEKK